LNIPTDQDQLEKSSPIQPELRAIDAYNPEEKLVGYVRDFGVTTMHTGHGIGALVSGQTMVVKTKPGKIDEVTLVPFEMLAMTIGASVEGNFASPGTKAKQIAMIRSEFLKAQAYLQKKNDKDTDPYGLGEVATKFIVANVGIEKLLGVYGALGQGKTFAQAFEVGTGVNLDDFYSMFEESRPTLGVPLGLSANTAPAPTPSPAPAPTVTPTPTASPALAKFTMEEVKKHFSASDCWAVVSGGVYDLTKWAALHPGGPAIIRSLCGRDATSDFLGRHENQPDPARELSNYIIGKLD
jgi:cytochrome b involved in lipid metabolism